MPDPVWITLGECSATGNCPQAAHTPGGSVLLRSTRAPHAVAEFTPAEFAQLVAWAKRQPEPATASGAGDIHGRDWLIQANRDWQTRSETDAARWRALLAQQRADTNRWRGTALTAWVWLLGVAGQYEWRWGRWSTAVIVLAGLGAGRHPGKRRGGCVMTDTDARTEATATIVVHTSYSECSACRGQTLVTGIQRHDRASGYGGGQDGCGATFTAITSGSIGFSPRDWAILAAMRPDLPIVDPQTGETVQEARGDA